MADSKLTENDIMYKNIQNFKQPYIYIKCTCHQLAVAFDDAFLLNIPLRTSFTISTNINPYTFVLTFHNDTKDWEIFLASRVLLVPSQTHILCITNTFC